MCKPNTAEIITTAVMFILFLGVLLWMFGGNNK
jgi:cbb3-type cytochrome oxidase subunit 3